MILMISLMFVSVVLGCIVVINSIATRRADTPSGDASSESGPAMGVAQPTQPVATTTPTEAPPPVRDNAIWASVAAGGQTSFAVQQDGTLFAWGNNLQTKFGNVAADQIAAVPVMENVAYVSAGHGHTMILDTDGVLWGVGSNNHGQLGDGTIAQRPYPIRVMENVTAVSTGQSHTVALTADGVVWAWGGNNSHQLGDDTRTTQHSPVEIMGDVVAISAGRLYTAAITSDGRLLMWGDCGCCQGGVYVHVDGTWDARRRGQHRVVMYDAIAVSASDGFTMAITTDGGLWAWGQNHNGQLGNGLNTILHEPVRVKDNVIAVYAGTEHTMAITADNVLWAWGGNFSGRLGDGTTATRHVPTRIMDDVAAVSAGNMLTMAIDTTGALWAWGIHRDMFGASRYNQELSPVNITLD